MTGCYEVGRMHRGGDIGKWERCTGEKHMHGERSDKDLMR